MIKSMLVIILSLIACLGFAQEAGPDEYKSFLVEWQQAWNSGKPEHLLGLLHPEGKLGNPEKMTEAEKAQFINGLKGMTTKLGNIERIYLGAFIEKKKRYVMRAYYRKQGLIPGTLVILQHKNEFKLHYLNIDGQGEPELSIPSAEENNQN